MGGGAYAEYIVLPENAVITKKSNTMSHEEAAPVGGITHYIL
jgi:D-arabinose 1-dehydrogenase-like Zn-dependent alcohol dehydrogenase